VRNTTHTNTPRQQPAIADCVHGLCTSNQTRAGTPIAAPCVSTLTPTHTPTHTHMKSSAKKKVMGRTTTPQQMKSPETLSTHSRPIAQQRTSDGKGKLRTYISAHVIHHSVGHLSLSPSLCVSRSNTCLTRHTVQSNRKQCTHCTSTFTPEQPTHDQSPPGPVRANAGTQSPAPEPLLTGAAAP